MLKSFGWFRLLPSLVTRDALRLDEHGALRFNKVAPEVGSLGFLLPIPPRLECHLGCSEELSKQSHRIFKRPPLEATLSTTFPDHLETGSDNFRGLLEVWRRFCISPSEAEHGAWRGRKNTVHIGRRFVSPNIKLRPGH